MISCNPFRVASFSFARRYHSCIRFALTSWIRFLPARSFELTASPSRWFDVEMTGPPKFLGNPSVPFAHAQATPVSRLVPDRDIRKCRFQNRRVVPARGSTKTLTRKLSKFSYMAFGLAVYASRCTLPIHHARLASGRWSDATRRDSHPQGHYQRFQNSIHIDTIFLCQASWRNPLFSPTTVLRTHLNSCWRSCQTFRRRRFLTVPPIPLHTTQA